MPRLLPRRKEREPGDEEKRIVKAQLHFIHELSLRNRSVDIIHIHFFIPVLSEIPYEAAGTEDVLIFPPLEEIYD